MRTYLIKIGNSQGVRLPKLLIEQVGLGKQVEIEAQPHQLVIRPVAQVPRQAWDEQFKAMA
ncbi:MAG: AbrB/MazE/SpoVT family DNA-binding domain-containing protein, partial [Abitibacteriaceae bacterium]|nr:AbrB/MazE/SpoVT family DNA-binding domain-containing protein [Abditibacteriaceae bacterium]